jgi:hypothetical protein
MKAKDPIIQTHAWNICFSTPVEGGKYRQTHYEGVLAETIDEAIATLREIYPDCFISGITKGTRIHHSKRKAVEG